MGEPAENSSGARALRGIRLNRSVRWALAAFGLGCFVLGAWAILKVSPSAQTAGSVLVVLGASLALISSLPVLPGRFSVKDVAFEFSEATMDELLPLLRDELSDEAFRAVLDLIERGSEDATGAAEIRQQATAVQSTQDSFEMVSRAALEEFIREVPDASDFDTEVVAQKSGRGRPPILDASFTFAGVKVAVEIKERYSESARRFLLQRLRRVLESEFALAVLVVPAEDYGRWDLEDIKNKIVLVTPEAVPKMEKALRPLIPQ